MTTTITLYQDTMLHAELELAKNEQLSQTDMNTIEECMQHYVAELRDYLTSHDYSVDIADEASSAGRCYDVCADADRDIEVYPICENARARIEYFGGFWDWHRK